MDEVEPRAEGTSRARWLARSLRWAIATFLGIALILLLANAAVVTVLERRVEARLAGFLDAPTEVDLDGWPAGFRALVGTVPQVTVLSGADGSVDVRLFEVDGTLLEAPSLLHAGRVQASLEGVVPPLLSPLEVSLRDLEVDLEQRSATAVDVFVEGGQGPRESVAAHLREVTVDLRARSPDPEQGAEQGRGTLLHASGRLRLEETALEALGLDATAATARFRNAVVPLSPAARDVARVGSAQVTLYDVAGDPAPLTLQVLEAELPQAQIRSSPEGTVLAAPGSTFRAVVTQETANELWRFPGRIELRQERARLRVAGLAVAFTLGVDDGRVVLRPRLPRVVRFVVGRLGVLRLEPRLPRGARLTDVEVRPGRLVLHGRFDRVVLRQEDRREDRPEDMGG